MATGNNCTPDQNEMLECLQGDQRGFTRLYDAYSGAILRLITHWVKDNGMAENLLQDVFVKAWTFRTQYDASKGRLFTWLYNIARNSCIDHFRSKGHKQYKTSDLSDNIPVLLPPHVSSSLPDTIGLRKMLTMLRQEEKEMIELNYFNGMTQREIAIIMNMPLGTVKTRLSMAIKNLRYFFKKDWAQAIQYISLN